MMIIQYNGVIQTAETGSEKPIFVSGPVFDECIHKDIG